MRYAAIFILLVGCIMFANSISQRDKEKAEKTLDPTEQTEKPRSAATPDAQLTEEKTAQFGDLEQVVTPASVESVVKQYEGMRLSFNPRYHIPNWVAWELTASEAQGTLPRAKNFMQDESVEGCPGPWEYSNSGYDRGHMAPAGDMKWDSEAMNDAFYMTNMVPQAKALNSGAWKTLEEKCRQWAKKFGEVNIVCGPVIDGDPIEYIGDSKIYVPRKFFKVIIAPNANPALGIGFIMPNAKVKGGMQPCAVTIDSVETLTGFDFFSSLPDSLENDLESQCKLNRWEYKR